MEIKMSKMKLYKYKKLIKNFSMAFIGNFVSKILSFIMVPFYTSILTTSDYGTADLISNIVFLVLPVFTLLMEEAVMRFALDEATNSKEVFSIALKVSTAGFVFALVISPIILLFKNIRPYYWAIILYYIVSWLFNILSNYAKGLDRFNITTISGIIHTFAFLALNVYFLAFLKIGIIGYLLAIIVSNFISIIYMFFSLKVWKNQFFFKRIDKLLAKKMVKYSLPMIPNYIMWWINNASDRIIISAICGTAINGVYSVAYKIPSLLSSVTSIFESAWRVSSVDDFGSEESIKFYNKIYAFYNGALLIGASFFVLITKLIAKILFAKEFFEAWKITPILILAYVFSALAQYLNSIFSASKQTKKIVNSSFAGAVVNILLNLLLIPHFAGIGAAVATLAGYIIIWVINMKNTRSILKMNLNLPIILISTLFIIIQIVLIELDSLKYYIFASLCLIVVIVLNRKIFIEIIDFLKQKVRNVKN